MSVKSRRLLFNEILGDFWMKSVTSEISILQNDRYISDFYHIAIEIFA